jgi:hypothetical protein
METSQTCPGRQVRGRIHGVGHAAGRAGRDDLARPHGHDRADVGHELLYAEHEIGDAGVLPDLPVDTCAAVVDQFEEGGFKQSGVGRLNGLRSLEEFLETKTLLHAVPASD